MKTALIVVTIVIVVVLVALGVASWAIRKIDEIGEDEERR